ncbi:MAG: hypothetical protein F6K25_05410 [Okeania sp. SIO2G4]|uniref:hypothetical protein n=1 Tax=unclassified Okeania TaxID=2634635 RepID=UPI0013BB30E7|nr:MULTISPECIES: hypothetical protein [unclassified Okeania]NEP05100.1 hypothetical protein [Okeania sp. SIO4D6]NEP38963.1 hypothetical protein [Okeania sp. SIO2H7]NEP71246.1 hypothetical protein [Okeania sp. SIO2G5]NEP92160.1 hypothetical protein [Okeania sp. SIO2F5]NEQ90189.1 hypothetical protein [Okeania sp. SIO2G4]
MKIGKIILIATSLCVTANQGLYADLFDTIKQLKIENPSCLECDVKIAEWQNHERSKKKIERISKSKKRIGKVSSKAPLNSKLIL